MINRKNLPKDVQEMLDNLLNKSPADLKLEEIGFLKARIDYLSESEVVRIPKMEEAEEVKPAEPKKEESKKVIKWQPKKK